MPSEGRSPENLHGGPGVTWRSYAVNDNTIYVGGDVKGGSVDGFYSITCVCLDEDCNKLQETSDIFSIVNGTVQHVFATESTYTHIATGEEWVNSILNEYDVQNIPPDKRIDPTIDVCAAGLCPTEEQWCQTDPNCSVSPYQEPPATVKGSVIAGFTVAGVVLLVIILYGVHLYLVHAQVNRYRARFARRIAETIDVRASVRNLTPDALAREFERIDEGVSKDGKISKEELWEFIASGKAGEMDQKDFDALFAAIDLDRNGEVDFVEFCAFMGKCEDEYRAARADRRSIVARRSVRASVAGTTARRLSSLPASFPRVVEDSDDDDDESKEEA
mmetsp:Transcript_22800/g.52763  ORF Transcript_22800/g.52763 Transcript_22800/m.52763 type:complete len:332 (+) Transcript_22800:322-1317(+)